MVEIASFVLDVVKCLAAPIGRPFKYLYNYNTNIKNLETEVTKLEHARDEVQVKVTAAERNMEEIKQKIEDWQTDVDSIIHEAEQLIQEKENNSRRLKGLSPNLKTRYKHSKKAFKLKENDISQLIGKNILPFLPQEDKVALAHPTIPQEISLRSDNEDYLVFESRTFIQKNVWDALNDDNIYMTGVYGMGGLGKTTLVQEVGRKAKKDKLFDDIVFVEVTETLDIKKVQTEIADQLGVKFHNESEREIELYERLESSKKILLILDNIWQDLDLKTIGIPSKMDCGGCKLLLTTRNLGVLQKMGSYNNFKMGILKEEEAWRLFMKMAGNVSQNRELNPLSNDVCKECGGLPIVICTIAKALRNNRDRVKWEEALRELIMPSPRKFTGLLEKAYSKIKLSYDYLESGELKKTFIISSLMENDSSISDLFKNIVSLDLFEGANPTIEQARDRLDFLLTELKESCLLLDGSTRERFSMHNVVRIIGIKCGYIEYQVFTERNDIEMEWKDKDRLRKCRTISLVGNNINTELWPEELDCPKLEFFYMRGSGSSFEIPKEFFTMMPKLTVLNLSRMQQSSLPLSIDALTNLQTLCLDYSKIKDVAIIGKLRKLKVLSLKDSDIEQLTIEIGQLTQLRLLDLSNCWRLKVIAPNVISKLFQLEELHIKGCPIQWKVEVLEELKGLSQLTSLELDIKDNKMLPKDFFSKELKRYKISIGDWPHRYLKINEDESLRMLEFKFNSTISLEDFWGVKNVETLLLAADVENSLDELQSNITPLFNEKVTFSNLMAVELQNICFRKIWDNQLSIFMSSSYQNLTQLTLWNCGNIKYAFPVSIAKSLQILQHLQICDCKVLEDIVAKEEGATIVNFVFPHVTLLKLEDLPKLTAFYPKIHTSEWPMLKELVVINCGKFTSEHMSFQENSEKRQLHISKPTSIFLDDKINSDLEELKLMNKLTWITWQSRSKTLEICKDKSANIPLGLLQRFENLDVLRLYWCRYKKIFSYGKDEKQRQVTLGPASASFQYLKVLSISNCRGLMTLITPSTARSLVQLREMSLQYCYTLIEIVENEGDATMSTEIVFDNLKKLSLIKLESLICFCSGNYSFNFPSLEDLIIGECPNMKTFSQGILTTPKLSKVNYRRLTNRFDWEEMELENKGNDLCTTIQGLYNKQDISTDVRVWTFKDINSTKIFYNQHPTSFYQNLTHLILCNCGNIKYVFPSSIAKSLFQLEHLNIKNCRVLVEIVAKEGAKDDGQFFFPCATSLKLENLPEFVAFYHTFEWPMLKELMVKDCDKFTTSEYLSFLENNREGELQFLEPKSLFLIDKINSDLEGLQLQNMIRNIAWQSRSKTLEIWNDKSANIPLGLLQRFENMKELQLSWCEYKEILSHRKDEKHTRILTQMQIRSFSMSSSAFQNLKVLRVSFCNGLMKLITPSTARSLVQLREMSIEFCEILVEIVGNEGQGDATTATEVVFSNLKRLSLKDLKSLTCFCSGNYTLKFPSLESLFISDCPNMKTFSQGILNTPKLHKVYYERWNELKWEKMIVENQGSDFNTNIQQAYKNQVDSNLEELRLSEKDILRIWQGELPKNFGKVKTLQLTKDESTNIPIRILHKFSSLENLNLQVSSYEELLSCGEDEEHIGTLRKLKVLELLGLFDLKCIWKQDPQLNSILQNLYHLVVQYCHNLTTLLPSLASFENLRTLRVEYCNGLKNLVSFSTARSLVRLEELRIEGCEVMAEVLANEEDIENGEIVFEKLKWLYLYKLESLTCFCSGKYTLKFPNLERLWWCGCSNMKAFSRGRLSMPGLQYWNEKDCSKSDHNTIIQQLQNDC